MITAAICNSFKKDILDGSGTHLASDVYKIALYLSAATLSKATTAYGAAGEVPNGNGYITGGVALSGLVVVLDGDVAIMDWTTKPTWNPATITARGALIYNASKSDKAVAVLDFGGDIVSTNGEFKVTLPAPAAATAVVRIA